MFCIVPCRAVPVLRCCMYGKARPSFISPGPALYVGKGMCIHCFS